MIRRGVVALLVAGLILLPACEAGGEQLDGLADPVIGRQGPLARGTIGDLGLAWVLSAEVEGESLCIELFGRGCVGIPDGQNLLQTRLTTSSSGPGPTDNYTCAYGIVSRDVARVAVEFADGAQRIAQMVRGHGWAGDFYVACIDRESPVTDLALFDDEGRALDLDR